jgi:uroporphyrinogen decarboxylase
MESKEIVLEALSLGRPHQVPVAVWGGGMWMARVMGTSLLEMSKDPEQMARVLQMAYDRLSFDILFLGSGYPAALYGALGGKLRFEGISAPKLEGPVLRDVGEAKSLPLSKLHQDPVLRTIRTASSSLGRTLGERAFLAIVINGPLTFAGQLLGVNQLMMALVDAPDQVQGLLHISVQAICLYLEPYLEERIVDGVALADPTASGDLISKKAFADFALPGIRTLAQWVREREAYLFLHICGNTADRLDLLAGSGIHCFSLDHKVDLASAKQILQSKVCLAGNVDPVEIMLRGKEREVEEKAKECIEVASPDGGYILMTGCDIPPDVSFENARALVRAARG